MTLRTGKKYPANTVDVRRGAASAARRRRGRGRRRDDMTLTPRDATRRVQYHETLGDLKRKVAEKTGVPVEQQQARSVREAGAAGRG